MIIFAPLTDTQMADTPKRRGRPPKDPNDTTTAPYVKHKFEPTGKRGRPKKNPYEGSEWGGVREGQGRPAYLKPAEKKSATILFMATPATKRRYELLKESGLEIAETLRNYIDKLAKMRLGANNIPDNWLPPKKR